MSLSQSLLLLLGIFWRGVVVLVRALYMSQVDLFKNYSYPTGLCAKKKKKGKEKKNSKKKTLLSNYTKI